VSAEKPKERKKPVFVSKKQKAAIIRRLDAGELQKDIMKAFNLSASTVSKIYFREGDPSKSRRRSRGRETTAEELEAVNRLERKSAEGWEERLEEVRAEREAKLQKMIHIKRSEYSIDKEADLYPRNKDWVRSKRRLRAGGGSLWAKKPIQDEPEIMRPDEDGDRTTNGPNSRKRSRSRRGHDW